MLLPFPADFFWVQLALTPPCHGMLLLLCVAKAGWLADAMLALERSFQGCVNTRGSKKEPLYCRAGDPVKMFCGPASVPRPTVEKH